MLNNGIDRVYLAIGVTDLRKSIDGLAILVTESFNLDPFSRSLFVFCNRKRDKIKILEWDTNRLKISAKYYPIHFPSNTNKLVFDSIFDKINDFL